MRFQENKRGSLQAMKRKTKSKIFLRAWPMFSFAGIFCARAAFADASGRVGAHSASGFLLTVLDVLLLLGVLFCLLSSLRVKSFLKEGELAYGWTLFSFSFGVFFIAQLLSLCVSSGLLSIPLSIIPLARLLSILCLALGIYFMKRMLS